MHAQQVTTMDSYAGWSMWHSAPCLPTSHIIAVNINQEKQPMREFLSLQVENTLIN